MRIPIERVPALRQCHGLIERQGSPIANRLLPIDSGHETPHNPCAQMHVLPRELQVDIAAAQRPETPRTFDQRAGAREIDNDDRASGADAWRPAAGSRR